MDTETETLKAAENLLALLLGLVQGALQERPENNQPSILETLAKTSTSGYKKRSYPYGRRAEVPLEEIKEKGIWPQKSGGPWPSKGDVFYRYDAKTKTANAFVWNSSSPFTGHHGHIFHNEADAIARYNTRKARQAAAKMREKIGKRRKRVKELEESA